jgi:hypothetical protein
MNRRYGLFVLVMMMVFPGMTACDKPKEGTVAFETVQ